MSKLIIELNQANGINDSNFSKVKIETIMAVGISQLGRSWFYYDRNKQYDLNKQTSLTQLKYTQFMVEFWPKVFQFQIKFGSE